MLRGSIVALITPFTLDNEVDFPALVKLVKWHLEEGTDAIMCLGTTAETPTLSPAEREQIIQAVTSEVKGKVPVIVGTGSYNTQDAVWQTKRAKELGADACLVVLPYYNRPSFAGCLRHFEEVAKVGLPIIIYHHPNRTGLKLSPEDLARICEIPEVIAVKEVSGDISYDIELRRLTKKGIFAGDDPATLPMIAVGAVGGISIIANVIPKEWKKLVHLCLEGKFKEALVLLDLYYPLARSLVLENNPQCVKYALIALGKIQPVLRLPLVIPTIGTCRQIEMSLENLGFTLPGRQITEEEQHAALR